jgi:cell division protein FtsQ
VGRGENRRRIDPAELAEARRVFFARALVVAAFAAASGAGVAVSALAWRWLTRGDAFRIQEVRFAGLERATPDELAAIAPVKQGDNVVLADVAGIERALQKHPWVRTAKARRTFPPAIEVAVEERRAAALVELGGLYLVDREAQVFKRAAPGDGLDLPLVTGLSRDDYVQRRAEVEPVLAGALALLESYAAAGLAEKAPVSEVHVDLEHGITIYVGGEGTQVRLGHGELAQKLSRLKSALAALEGGGRRAEVVHLDNRTHPSWVTVRLAGGVSEAGDVASLASRAGGKGSRGP